VIRSFITRTRTTRLLLAGFYAACLLLAVLLDMRSRVDRSSSLFILSDSASAPARFTCIVLGCRVNGDDPSACLEERLTTALSLYEHGRVQRLLVSGDHGTKQYDEVNAMRDWFVQHGVPVEHVFLDHAGFDTYDTMVRALKVFEVRDALVVSQAFHLPRAVYLARNVGIDALGVSADPPHGSICRGSAVREPVACMKAVLNVTFHSSPHFLGPVIPIRGTPHASFDR
jgi:SanA protein